MKILLLLILLALELFSFDSETASKIFDKIFVSMLKKENIKVYTSNDIYKDVIKNSSNLKLCIDYTKADIILVNGFNEIPKDSNERLLFATSYPVFRDKKNVVGAFYWNRGHIKIEFSLKRLNKYDLTLPASFSRYIKDDI